MTGQVEFDRDGPVRDEFADAADGVQGRLEPLADQGRLV